MNNIVVVKEAEATGVFNTKPQGMSNDMPWVSQDLNSYYQNIWHDLGAYAMLNWQDSQTAHPVFLHFPKLSPTKFVTCGSNDKDNLSYVPNGDGTGIYYRSRQLANNLIHETIHWLIASPERRNKVNYDLGLNDEVDTSPSKEWAILEEAKVSLLNILALRWFGIRAIAMAYPLYDEDGMIMYTVSSSKKDYDEYRGYFNDKNTESEIRKGRKWQEKDAKRGWDIYNLAVQELTRDKAIRVHASHNGFEYLSICPEWFGLDYSHSPENIKGIDGVINVALVSLL